MEINAEYLRKRYSTMETEELIELQRKGNLSEVASDALDEVLKSRGITEHLEETMPLSTEEKMLQGVVRKRIAGLSIGWWLNLFVVAVIGGTIFNYQRAQSTNRAYLKELIESHMIEKTASELVVFARKADGTKGSDDEWKTIERGLSDCMVREASLYLKSDDPYLHKRANKNTPQILASRFLKECGVIE